MNKEKILKYLFIARENYLQHRPLGCRCEICMALWELNRPGDD